MATKLFRFNTKKLLLLAIALALVISLASMAGTVFAASGFRLIKADLTGAAEVPGPGDPDGSGSARVRLFPNDSTVCFTIKVKDILLPAIGAHIHAGTSDVAGPIVIGLAPPDESGTSKGCVEADEDLIRDIFNNPSAYYINVHTNDFPGGAVRGQVTK
jgi:hypothetical protein